MIYYYTHSPHEHGLETKALVEHIRKRPECTLSESVETVH